MQLFFGDAMRVMSGALPRLCRPAGLDQCVTRYNYNTLLPTGELRPCNAKIN